MPSRNFVSGESNNLSTNWLSRLIDRPNTSIRDYRLEEIVNIDRDVSLFSNDELNSLNPSRLYSQGIFNNSTGLFRYLREVEFYSPNNVEIRLNFITPEAATEIKRKNNHTYIHMGLVILEIRGLARKKTGGKTLICSYDNNRFGTPNEVMIDIIVVDMNNNVVVAYIVPDITMTLNDLEKHTKIFVQAKRYENFKGENLCLSIIFPGKIMANIETRFKIKGNLHT